MAKKRKTNRIKKGNEGLADLLSRVEKEAEKIVTRIRVRAEKSSVELKKNIAALVTQIKDEGIYQVASEKKSDLRELADNVISTAREIEFGTFNRDLLIRDAKKNLGGLLEKVQGSELFIRAKDTAALTKNQVLTVLSIPSQSEVKKLSRKIATLETRIKKLSRKAA